MKKTMMATTALVLLSILLGACNLQPTTPTQMGPDQISTIAKATVDALTTQMAPPPATATPPLPTATATLSVPTLDLTIPTLSLATSTLIPLPTTASSSTCNRGFFVSETIKDGTVYKPGANFVKTWTIRNDGTCTWTSAYRAVPVINSPESPVITGDNAVGPTTSIPPGGTWTITANMVAPKEDGTYQQWWKFTDADGKYFGIGNAGDPWYVIIKVSKTGVVTPSSVVASVNFDGANFNGLITATNTTITYNWQVYKPATSAWVNLTSNKSKVFNGTDVPVDPYTDGLGAACTAAGVTSGNTVTVRLNLNEYGYRSSDQTCP